eukprot:356447_1
MYDNSNCPKNIIKQQILDKIHCHYFHSFDTGYKLSNIDKIRIREMIDDSKENDDKNSTIYDKSIQQIYRYITDKKLSYQNVSGLDRINNNISAKFCTKLSVEYSIIRYSFGIRYFYWTYYKNNLEINDASRYMNQAKPTPANEGYTVSDFYVEIKFKDLKDELINNPLCSISVCQWNNLVTKAKDHLNTNHFKEKICTGFTVSDHKDSEIYYDLPSNSP